MSEIKQPTLKRRLFGMSIALVMGLGVFVGGLWLLARTLGNKEPLFQGRPLHYWCEQLNSPDSAVSNRVQGVVDKVVLPQLIEVMLHDTNDSRLRVALVEKLNTLPGIYINFTPAEGRRVGAARNLGGLGPSAQAAIPVLIQALKSADAAVHGPVLSALGGIHSEPDLVIPLLMSYLDNPDLNDEAAEALGNFGPLAKAALPKLVPLLKVADKDLHHAVVEALKKIDPKLAAETGVNRAVPPPAK